MSCILKISFNRSFCGGLIAEAALVIPIVVGIVFFTVEFGNVFHLWNTLNHVARSGVRYAAVTPTYTQQGIVNASGASSILPDISRLTLTVIPIAGAPKCIGRTITVTASYNYTPVINPFRLLSSNNSWAPAIQSTAVMRSEVRNNGCVPGGDGNDDDDSGIDTNNDGDSDS